MNTAIPPLRFSVDVLHTFNDHEECHAFTKSGLTFTDVQKLRRKIDAVHRALDDDLRGFIFRITDEYTGQNIENILYCRATIQRLWDDFGTIPKS